jgi:predicted transcriptional regulator
MEKSLLVIERIVLESLEKGALELSELEKQCGLNHSLLKAVLHELINRGVVCYSMNEYSLNWKSKDSWIHLLKNKEGVKAEIKELFSSLVNRKYEHDENSTLKVQKIWLKADEIEDLERRLKDIDFFIEDIRKRRKTKPVGEKVFERQVLFYGACRYDNLVDSILKAS